MTSGRNRNQAITFISCKFSKALTFRSHNENNPSCKICLINTVPAHISTIDPESGFLQLIHCAAYIGYYVNIYIVIRTCRCIGYRRAIFCAVPGWKKNHISIKLIGASNNSTKIMRICNSIQNNYKRIRRLQIP